MIDNKITRLAEIRAVNKDDRTAEFVLSTESVDRHGTVFKLDGWDTTPYRTNPIVSYNHNAGADDPDLAVIGTSEVRFEDGKMVGVVRFEEGNPIADKVVRKLANGTLRSASIGAHVHEGHWGDEKQGEDRDTFYFTRQELIEWSVVSVGSNRDALKRSAEIIEQIKNESRVVEQSAETKRNLKLIEQYKRLK